MDGDSWMLYILLVALILGGGYFAGAEIAFASVNKIRLKTQADAGNRKAKTAVYITEHFESALTTLLIGNNIVHISTASLATLLAKRLWGLGAVTWATIVTTVVVFFVSEMLPKNYSRSHAESTALALAGSLRFLMRVLKPVAWFFDRLSTLCAKLFGSKRSPSVTTEELEHMIVSAQDSSAIQPDDSRLLSAAVAFDHVTVAQAMQPVCQLEALEVSSSIRQMAIFAENHRHSRLPIYRGDLNHIIGVIHVRDFLRAYLKQGEGLHLRPLLSQPAFVRPDTPIDEVLRQLSLHRIHLAVVQDDAGKTLGILTVEDILEELVGDIQDEEDQEGAVQHA